MILAGRAGYFCASACVVTHNPATIANSEAFVAFVPSPDLIAPLCMLVGAGAFQGHDERRRWNSQSRLRAGIPPRGTRAQLRNKKMRKQPHAQ
ncbi:hypothetical protein [Bradyrhizobium genosp. SA-3]|uniref:hypothetical protein n=1 Tax=Bradyrhizobium genosp. SA-3 TaxID=508868 RepID=UPI0013EED21A|nr:hypothetical protein [Bradyrhizobium genosp. SA-3]